LESQRGRQIHSAGALAQKSQNMVNFRHVLLGSQTDSELAALMMGYQGQILANYKKSEGEDESLRR